MAYGFGKQQISAQNGRNVTARGEANAQPWGNGISKHQRKWYSNTPAPRMGATLQPGVKCSATPGKWYAPKPAPIGVSPHGQFQQIPMG